MKPERGRCQAATQVKGWSPENDHNPEADTVQEGGRQNSRTAKGEAATTLAGSKTAAWDQEDDLGTWETQGVALMSGVGSDKP